jgi:type II secretory pathway pseudopilin PulG
MARRLTRLAVTGITRRLSDDRGFTIVEVLISIALLTFVVGAVMAALVLAQNEQVRDANYAYAQNDARTGLDQMVSQIRQATSINASGPNYIDMNVNLNGSAYRVGYECDITQTGTTYRECVRVQASSGASLPAFSGGTVEINQLTNGTVGSPVFSWGPDPVAPYYMTATVMVPASDSHNPGLTHSIVFSDGALMRNENVGN